MRNRAIFPILSFFFFGVGCAGTTTSTPIGVSTAGISSHTSDAYDARPALQLVESVPLETTLTHAEDVVSTDQAWLDMIDHAKQSLSLEIFYASSSSGDKLAPILDAIGMAAKRKVDVRLLFDSTFYEKNKETENALAQMPGVHVRLIDIHAKTTGVMHAKYFVVDDEDAYIGSANFDGRALDHIQEIGVRVKSKEVAHVIDQVFRTDWREAEDLDPRRGGTHRGRESGPLERTTSYAPKPLALPLPQLPIALSYGGEREGVVPVVSPRVLMPEGYAALDELPRLEDAIDHAKTSIDVQLLTYAVSTDDVTHKFTILDDALRRAAARGVHVRLLVSDWNLDDDKIESLRELVRGSKVDVEIFTIPPFSQGFIPYARVSHAKYMVVDGRIAWVGSSNWEESYFTRTRNLGLLIDGKKFAGELDTLFERDWASAYAKAFDVNATYTPRKRDQ